MRHSHLRLGVNIDHVATIRNARGGGHPNPVRAAIMAAEAGADGITLHLREDRRHIRDADLTRMTQVVLLPLNLEMAATPEMLAIALKAKPHAVCIVPERRAEVTTEGGLDAQIPTPFLRECIKQLDEAGIRVSLFIDPSPSQAEAAKFLGAPVVEFHTGRYCEAAGEAQDAELARIREAVTYAARLGLECHAGHGLTYDNVARIAAIPELAELNIGHFLIGEAVFCGLKEAIRRMRHIMDVAREDRA